VTEVSNKLPPNFADLDLYVEGWSLPSEKDRAIKRIASSMSDLRNFHKAVFPRLDAIIDYLNTFPNDPDELPAAEKYLYDLSLMAMEAAAPIDLGWTSPDIDDVFPIERFEFAK
jgi:hypothetical protein